MPQISVIVPLYNEEESLRELYRWIQQVMDANGFTFEVVFVDDGSSDRSWKVIEELAEGDNHIRGIKFRGNQGKSLALNAGFLQASGEVVITMDADLQDSPNEIPELYAMIVKDGYDMVSGWKKKRYDPLSKTIPTKLYNWTARQVSGLKLHDFNCGLKAYRKEAAKAVDIYGELHRFVPMLVQSAGFSRIGEKEVAHQARKYGHTKFGLERFMNGMLDMVSIGVLRRFGRRPMHFFGALGFLMFIISFCSAGYIGVSKLYYLSRGIDRILVTQNPWFYIALVGMILGTQLFMTGFISELMVKNRVHRHDFNVDKTI